MTALLFANEKIVPLLDYRAYVAQPKRDFRTAWRSTANVSGSLPRIVFRSAG
jgi:hypothetical protein